MVVEIFYEVFNAEAQSSRGAASFGKLEFRVRGCPQNSTPIVGKRGSATASPLLRAFQPIII